MMQNYLYLVNIRVGCVWRKQLLKLVENYVFCCDTCQMMGLEGMLGPHSFIHSFTQCVVLLLAILVILNYLRQMRNTGGRDFQRSCFYFVFSNSSKKKKNQPKSKDFLYLEIIGKMNNKLYYLPLHERPSPTQKTRDKNFSHCCL